MVVSGGGDGAGGGKRVVRAGGWRFEEFAPEHKHSCVGISSKRISHLIKTSAQLPGR